MIPVIIGCLRTVKNARFYETERGYQGELLAVLRSQLALASLPGDAIVEQEYQKRLPAHGINVRPDIIVHVPTLAAHDRRENNFIVFELNLRAGSTEAEEDFSNLDAVIAALDYRLGVFVNIGTDRTQAAHYSGPFKDRLHFFAVRRIEGTVELRHAYYSGRALVEEGPVA